ncbi:hypothetical protein AVEN_235180-1, partial [Araneus ventricosus]
MEINNEVLEFMPGNETVYKAVDMIMSEDPQDQLTFLEEFLNFLTPTGLPPYELKVENSVKIRCMKEVEKFTPTGWRSFLQKEAPSSQWRHPRSHIVFKLYEHNFERDSFDGDENLKSDIETEPLLSHMAHAAQAVKGPV